MIVSILLLTGCAGARYHHLQDPNFDFTTITTFSCSECASEVITRMPQYDNVKNRTLIRESIIEEMQNLGYTYTDEQGDVFVEYVISVESKVDTVAKRSTDYRYWTGLETYPYNYRKGTIFVNVVDASNNTLVWQGTAHSVLDKNPRNVEKNISNFVKRIFLDFPPKGQP